VLTAEELAMLFHSTYERLAPKFEYETRLDSRKTWKDVPDNNRNLMIATSEEVIRILNLNVCVCKRISHVQLRPDECDDS